MIGLDTNILVRYVTQDHPTQVAAADRLIEGLSAQERGFVSLVVVVELIWVLEVSYSFKRTQVEQVLEKLLQSKELALEQAETLWQALRRSRASGADITDCLIERRAHSAECDYTITFDRKAARRAGMRLLAW
jgi:predicted nucleic-acid-binding protein